jgi:hypothetical protein
MITKGTAITSTAADWPINPSFDLGDPQFARSGQRRASYAQREGLGAHAAFGPDPSRIPAEMHIHRKDLDQAREVPNRGGAWMTIGLHFHRRRRGGTG